RGVSGHYRGDDAAAPVSERERGSGLRAAAPLFRFRGLVDVLPAVNDGACADALPGQPPAAYRARSSVSRAGSRLSTSASREPSLSSAVRDQAKSWSPSWA